MLNIYCSNRSQLITVVDKIIKHGVAPSSKWNFKSRIINRVYEIRESLIKCIKEIESTFNQTIAINQALRRMLNERKFIFCLKLFNSLTPRIGMVYNELRKRTFDPVKVAKAIF